METFLLGSEFWWTPEHFWNGYQEFHGLKTAVEKSRAHRIDIVLSQCQGKHFADGFERILPPALRRRVVIHGLSYGSTRVRYSMDCSEDDIWLRKQMHATELHPITDEWKIKKTD